MGIRTANLSALLIDAFCIAVALVTVSGGPWILEDYTAPPPPAPLPPAAESPHGFYHPPMRPAPDTVWLVPLLVFGSIYLLGGVLTARLGTTRSWRRAALAGAFRTWFAFAVLCMMTWRPVPDARRHGPGRPRGRRLRGRCHANSGRPRPHTVARLPGDVVDGTGRDPGCDCHVHRPRRAGRCQRVHRQPAFTGIPWMQLPPVEPGD